MINWSVIFKPKSNIDQKEKMNRYQRSCKKTVRPGLHQMSTTGKHIYQQDSKRVERPASYSHRRRLGQQYFSMCYVQGATIGDLLVGHLRKLVLL
ncbi:hypothetical protein BpHYR1_020731 [Brachionus plicatilis]|uniref:Uncharacterized protein n=1 Tax=Brachionus plicatilis TaxID=10195 RepID=A0A3M7RW57_BRAPC|nr:hypothetical protein BpHYR1_020731 [Brachionus plicatilis]